MNSFAVALTAGLLFVVSIPASADNADLGAELLRCFHPSGDFRGITIGDAYTDGNGYAAYDGKIEFAGGISGKRYYMRFIYRSRKVDGESEYKVEPGEDTAPFPPSPNCRYRSWTAK